MRDKVPLDTQRIPHLHSQRYRRRPWRMKDKEISRVAFGSGMIGIFLIALIAYLITRDPTVVAIWTSWTTLTVAVITYFSRKK